VSNDLSNVAVVFNEKNLPVHPASLSMVRSPGVRRATVLGNLPTELISQLLNTLGSKYTDEASLIEDG
jgi:hypothetical protein